jgi:hypothetical protein
MLLVDELFRQPRPHLPSQTGIRGERLLVGAIIMHIAALTIGVGAAMLGRPF